MSRSVLGALTLACLVLLTGCSSLEGAGDKGYVGGNGTVRVLGVDERDEPITLTGDDLEGEPLDLADFRGRPTVVNVWGSWCAECVAEAPDLVEAADELGESASFVGINVRDPSTAQALAHDRKFGVEYPSFYDPDGRALLAFEGALSPRAVPATIVLDAEGRVAAQILGVIPSTQTLVDVVEDVAAGKSTDG